jgi:hypothetical protein
MRYGLATADKMPELTGKCSLATAQGDFKSNFQWTLGQRLSNFSDQKITVNPRQA